jgi:hypothetical protein
MGGQEVREGSEEGKVESCLMYEVIGAQCLWTCQYLNALHVNNYII